MAIWRNVSVAFLALVALLALPAGAQAAFPGAVTEGARAIWSLDRIMVHDGGPDGDVDTPGNALLATQGIFAP